MVTHSSNLDLRRQRSRLELRTLAPSGAQDQRDSHPGPYPGCEELEHGSETPRQESKDVPTSSRQTPQANDNSEAIITNIRATDVAVGLRRIPAGFYISIQHSGREWRTENKPISASDDVVEWATPIPIPSNLSATICLVINASFEFQPMLGDGEQLRKLTITVEQLLDRSETHLPFIFFPKDIDVVSPCTFVSVTVKQQRCKNSNSLVLNPHRPAEGSLSMLEEATNQGHSALSRYRKNRGKEHLERSIHYFERALDICPLDHPCRAAAQSNVAMAKFIHCRLVDVITPLDVPLALFRDVLAARPVGHPDRPSTLIHLATVHLAQFEKRKDAFDVAQAETLLHEATKLYPVESHGRRVSTFLLQLLEEHNVDPVFVQEAGRSFVPQDLGSDPIGSDLWASVILLNRFEQLGNLADLQQAISLLEQAVRSLSLWDHRHVIALALLGGALAQRFEHLGEQRDLEQAISGHRDAVDLIPDGHPSAPDCLCQFGSTLLLRFLHIGNTKDLEDAISSLEHAVDISPADHFASLNHLGISLLTRFERFGEPRDLEEAISKLKDAVHLAPDGNPSKLVCLNNLSKSLYIRFLHFGNTSELEDAILNSKIAIDLTPDGNFRKPGHLNTLGCVLFCRFKRLGDLSDLEQAILGLTKAVRLTPDGHPQKPDRLSNLGSFFFARFQHLGQLTDLERAIHALINALDLIPDDHPNKRHVLNNLGIILKHRFEHLGELSDIEKAVSILKYTVHLTPDGHPDKLVYLNNLGESLRIRFEHLQEPDDIEESISRLRDTIYLTPDGHPDLSHHLNNLGNSFLSRFEHFGELSDLEQTISRYTDTVGLVPDGHPYKPEFIRNLGLAFFHRFERLQELGDGEQAISLFSHAARASVGSISARFHASKDWIRCARTLRHHSLLDAYSLAISLLPQVAWIGLTLTNRFHELIQATNIVREAASAALDAGYPETAVEWLEQGRSIVWGELFQLRSVHEELSSAHPYHARRLQELSAALEHVGAAHEKSLSLLSEPSQLPNYRTMVTLEQEATKHRALAIERDKLLQVIRRLPGFERFLLHKEFSQLLASAHSGPVVVLNAAKTRCDALIVLAGVNHVIHVPLRHFTLQRSKTLQNTLKSLLGPARDTSDDNRVGKPVARECISWESVLSTIWASVVKPVLDALAFSSPGDLRRIFWCPTGPFAFLPIHAAGIYGAEFSKPGHKLSDFVVSSYIPTISILAPLVKLDVRSREDVRLLTVRQPSSDGQSQLPGVETELKYIRAVTQNCPSAQITLVESCAGTVEEVLSLMKDADWVHFACHGIQDDANPADSGLCLADRRRLKLSDIISVSRPRGGLAFLSACQTATGDKILSDEAIHIAAGMLFAGYGGVVGTMWSISDRLAPRVAKDVYQQLFQKGARPDYREAARALQDAVGRLRDSNASFVEWIPFIHVGL